LFWRGDRGGELSSGRKGGIRKRNAADEKPGRKRGNIKFWVSNQVLDEKRKGGVIHSLSQGKKFVRGKETGIAFRKRIKKGGEKDHAGGPEDGPEKGKPRETPKEDRKERAKRRKTIEKEGEGGNGEVEKNYLAGHSKIRGGEIKYPI